MDLYFECKSGISGDMAVAALLDLGNSQKKLDEVLKSMNLEDEFSYKISKVEINSIKATDFDVIVKDNFSYSHNENGNKDNKHQSHHHNHHKHIHSNLDDVYKIIDKAKMNESACNLAKKIFEIVARAEAKVHGKDIKDVHFHEVGAIDSIVDIVSFAFLFDDLNPDNVYFSTLTEGSGTIKCQHGILNVPVPAVCEIASSYKLPLKITENDGEMVTPTGAAIVAALNQGKALPQKIIIDSVGYGAGKRKYVNPILRVMKIKGD